jgi:hypothetical protein
VGVVAALGAIGASGLSEHLPLDHRQPRRDARSPSALPAKSRFFHASLSISIAPASRFRENAARCDRQPDRDFRVLYGTAIGTPWQPSYSSCAARSHARRPRWTKGNSKSLINRKTGAAKVFGLFDRLAADPGCCKQLG